MTIERAATAKPNGKWLIVGFVVLWLIGLLYWKYVDFRLVRVLRGHTERVSAIAFSPDGKYLISADDNGDIFVWDQPDWVQSQKIRSQSHGVSLAILPDSQSLIYTDGDHATWASLPGGEPLHRFSLPLDVQPRGMRGSSVSLSQDGKRFVMVGGAMDYSEEGKDTGFVAVWDLTTRELVEPPRVLEEAVTNCAISPDGEYVGYRTARSFTRVIYRIGEPGEFESVEDGIDLCFTPDSSALLIEQGSTMELLSVQNGKGPLVGSRSESFRGLCLCFSPNGKFVARGGFSDEFQMWGHGTIQLYSFPEFDRVTDYHSNENRYGKNGSVISCVAISPDGTIIAAGSLRGQVRIWKMPQ